jgi:hypothetical protein
MTSVSISADLVIRVGCSEMALSPREGLELAEELARKAFRRVLEEEAAKTRCRRDAPRIPVRGGRQ